MEITEDTEIPEIKPKKDRLKEPSREAFEEAQKKKDEIIEKERHKLSALIDKIKMVRGGGRVQGGDMSLKDFMGQKNSEIGKLDASIQVEDKAAKRIEDEIQELYGKRDQLN